MCLLKLHDLQDYRRQVKTEAVYLGTVLIEGQGGGKRRKGGGRTYAWAWVAIDGAFTVQITMRTV